jgi:hypothetical protein
MINFTDNAKKLSLSEFKKLYCEVGIFANLVGKEKDSALNETWENLTGKKIEPKKVEPKKGE